jgi:hypothetical protein
VCWKLALVVSIQAVSELAVCAVQAGERVPEWVPERSMSQLTRRF